MAAQVGLFVYSNVQYPYGCTMDFRYLAPAVLPGAVFLGAAVQRLWRSKREWHQYLAAVLCCVVFLFCISGILFVFDAFINRKKEGEPLCHSP